jgi:DNA-binding LytR/AlgR family response regulator
MKFLIIEDEVAASTRLKRMVTSIRPDAECLTELRGVDDAVHWFAAHGQAEIDVAFVDIQLSDGISFELFDLVDITFPVIFTTAYDHYVLRVFQVHTIDYLLKPIKLEQLNASIEKLDLFGGKPELRTIQAAIAAMPATPARQRFVVKSGHAIRVVSVTDVSYFYSEYKITHLVCLDGRRSAVDHTLDQLESMLDPLEFHRANRQYIVGIKSIDEMHTYSRSRLKLVLTPPASHDVVVSTEKASHFKDWLQGKTPE